MAIDIAQQVTLQLPLFLKIDAELVTTIPLVIEAQTALAGWTGRTLTDQEKMYVVALTLEGLLPRLLQFLADEAVELEIKDGERIKMPPREEFSKQLKDVIKALKATAAAHAQPDEAAQVKPWPGCGIKAIR